MILEGKPYEVIVAEDGDQGIRLAREKSPDLILLDIIMPVKDGFTAAEQIKKDEKLRKIPLLMLTSFSQRHGETNLAVSRGMTLEAEDYLDKPVPPKQLLATIDRHLKKLGF
jgi:two-component system alkaline phosphatase synthesis response regulator PhoP